MSKLIVEMEMPKACSWVEKGIEKRCPMAGVDHYLQTRCRGQSGRIVHTINQSGGVDRPSWCPIVGVLPEEHWDLIDRDALLETCIYYDINPNKSVVDADNIQDMPVIIAAERNEHGTTAN